MSILIRFYYKSNDNVISQQATATVLTTEDLLLKLSGHVLRQYVISFENIHSVEFALNAASKACRTEHVEREATEGVQIMLLIILSQAVGVVWSGQ